ncbi:sensor histidine kinase [Brevibacillus sp. SIMBA_040]|uniref:sensor histidine kinase n=1 Tax=unclassified Brevibacillus TaxID=2684853 RepID=UPI00397B1AC2
MRTIRIRTFTLLCFFFLLSLPWIFYVTAHFMENQTFSLSKSQKQNETLQRNLAETIHLIETSTGKWMDPNWHNELDSLLQKTKLDVVILSASDREIYRSDPGRRSALSSTEKFSVIEDGRLVGRVIISLPKSNIVQIISMVSGLILAFIIIGVVMRRLLLRPLEKMSIAARQIATGDWDVKLPMSGITEIAEVRDGFDVMVKGLQQSHLRQVELEEERRFVIAAVAHDLRTPLFALRGYLDGLEQGIAQSPEKITKYLAVCRDKSAQLDRLVEDLLTYTKMEYVETKRNNKPVDLTFILCNSIDSLSPLARQKQISISTKFTGSCMIKGDTHLLERAMNNLLENAVRHTPSDGEIVVHCFTDGNKVKLSIRDTGPGFSAEELNRAFEPLYRGEVSRNRSTGGSGLGLTISQRIVRQHGGELCVSNHPDGGALLAGWIPAAASIIL